MEDVLQSIGIGERTAGQQDGTDRGGYDFRVHLKSS
jgi:hypothetical protein